VDIPEEGEVGREGYLRGMRLTGGTRGEGRMAKGEVESGRVVDFEGFVIIE
jgi:hypothetical protein